MNKLYKFFMLLGVVALMASCNKDPEYYELPDQPDEMHVGATLGVNSDSEKNLIVLSGTYSNETALKLTWSQIQADAPVSYLVRFYATESKNDDHTAFFADGEAGCIGTFGKDESGNMTYTITHNDLNTIVARWAFPGDEISITAQVVGTINNELVYIKPQTSTVDVNVVGWEKYPISLIAYITDARGKLSTLELTQNTLGTGVYTGKMNVTAGTVYFQKPVTSKQAASYYMDENGKLKYIDEEVPNAPTREDELQFPITETGTLMVDVNDEYLDVRVLNIKMPEGAQPYMVGDGIDVGWVLNEAAYYMTPSADPRTPYIYSWTGNFYAPGAYPAPGANGTSDPSKGEFKVLTANSWGGMGFYAPEAGANPAENHILTPARNENEGGDNKWVVAVTGKYTFSINALDMTTSFEPAN